MTILYVKRTNFAELNFNSSIAALSGVIKFQINISSSVFTSSLHTKSSSAFVFAKSINLEILISIQQLFLIIAELSTHSILFFRFRKYHSQQFDKHQYIFIIFDVRSESGISGSSVMAAANVHLFFLSSNDQGHQDIWAY